MGVKEIGLWKYRLYVRRLLAWRVKEIGLWASRDIASAVTGDPKNIEVDYVCFLKNFFYLGHAVISALK